MIQMCDLSYLHVLITIKYMIRLRLINWGMYLVHLEGSKTLTRLRVAILKERLILGNLRRCGRKENINSLNYIDLPLYRVQVKAGFNTVLCNITGISWPARRLLICVMKTVLRGIS